MFLKSDNYLSCLPHWVEIINRKDKCEIKNDKQSNGVIYNDNYNVNYDDDNAQGQKIFYVKAQMLDSVSHTDNHNYSVLLCSMTAAIDNM